MPNPKKKTIAEILQGTSAAPSINPASSFTPAQVKTAQTAVEQKKQQRAEARISDMGGGVGGGMGIGTTGRRTSEIASLTNDINDTNRSIRSARKNAFLGGGGGTMGFLGEGSVSFAQQEAKKSKEKAAEAKRIREQNEQYASEVFPTKYSNLSGRAQTDATLNRLANGGESTQQDYELLKQDQYYHWTKDELQQGIKDNENRISDLEYRSKYYDENVYGNTQEISELKSKTEAQRRALEYLAYGEEFAKLPETVQKNLTENAGKWLDEGKYQGGREYVGVDEKYKPGAESREKVVNLKNTLKGLGYNDKQINGMVEYARRMYNAKKAKEDSEYWQGLADKNFGGRVLASAASVAGSVGGGVPAMLDMAYQRIANKTDPFTGTRMSTDYNSRGQEIANMGRRAREAVSHNYEERFGSTGSFVYNTAMSIADFLLASSFGNIGAEIVLGSSAAQAAAQEAHERGASDNQALAVGLTAGVAEALFEHISLEKLSGFRAITEKVGQGGLRLTARDVAKSIGVQSFTEGTEELATTIAKTITDAMIMADKSEINTAIQKNKSLGMSEEEATRQAWIDWAKNASLDFLGGALSGGTVGSVQGLHVPIYQAKWNSRVGDQEQQDEKVSTLNAASFMPRSSRSRQIADSIGARIVSGKTVYNKEFGKLAYAYAEDVAKGVEQGNDSTYTFTKNEKGEIVPSMQLGETADNLVAKGLSAKDAIKYGNRLEILVNGDMNDLKDSDIKNMAFIPAVRKVFTEMTGKELPERASKSEFTQALKQAAIEYREEQYKAKQAAEAQEAEQAEGEMHNVAVEEAQQYGEEQATRELDNAIAQAESEATESEVTESELPEMHPPALTREEYIEQYKQRMLDQIGIEVTDEQAEKAWQRYSEDDGVRLDDGRMIGRKRFFKENREFYANQKDNPIDLTDEQLEQMYQRDRADSSAKPYSASAYAVEEGDVIPSKSAAESAKESATAEAVQDTGNGTSESDALATPQVESKSEASAVENTETVEQATEEQPKTAKVTQKVEAEKAETEKAERKPRQKKKAVIPTKAEVEAKRNAKSNAKANKNISHTESPAAIKGAMGVLQKSGAKTSTDVFGTENAGDVGKKLPVQKAFNLLKDEGIVSLDKNGNIVIDEDMLNTLTKKNARHSVPGEVTEATTAQEITDSNPQISREQAWTALYLKPYLKKLGINRIIFDSRETGDSEGFVVGDSIYLNEKLMTSAKAITKVIGHELIHPATTQTRKESGDENKSVAEDVISFAEQLNKDGMLSKTADGAKIKYQLEHMDEVVQERRERYQKFYEEQGDTIEEIERKTTDAMMREEIAADWFGMMLYNQNILERLAGVKPDFLTRVLRVIDRMKKKVPNGVIANNGKEFRKYLGDLDDLADRVNGALTRAKAQRETLEKNNPVAAEMVERMGPDTNVETNEDGELVFAQSEDGQTTSFSLVTYVFEGENKLRKALEENGHTVDEINDVINRIHDVIEFLQEISEDYSQEGYENLATNLMADILTDVRQSKQVLSAMVKNGDYPVNFDLALICKKRVAYMRILGRLVEDGVLDQVTFDANAIAKVNEILRDAGFETACLGCFVESRRQQIQDWAEAIVTEWNAAVDARVKNADDFGFAKGGNEKFHQKTEDAMAELQAIENEYEVNKLNEKNNISLSNAAVRKKMGQLLDKAPSLLHHLTVADLITPQGITALRERDGSLFSLVQQRYGANSPKIVQEFNPYNSEIADLTFDFVKKRNGDGIKGKTAYEDAAKAELGAAPVKEKGESAEAFEVRKKKYDTDVQNLAMRNYLYDIGGIRMQSFSDFMIENVLDYVQMYADMAAKRVPMHGYTKEITCLRLFGMTGAKWNGSLIAHVDPELGKEEAGLLPVEEAANGRGVVVTDPLTGKEYAICFDDYQRNKDTKGASYIQSIGFKDVVALQLDPRYSANVGSITIGVSDAQIRAMLNHPLFSMVIPYHKSGMNPLFAKLVGVSVYNDYTPYQNTTIARFFDKNGKEIFPTEEKKSKKQKADETESDEENAKKPKFNPFKKGDKSYHASTQYDFNGAVQDIHKLVEFESRLSNGETLTEAEQKTYGELSKQYSKYYEMAVEKGEAKAAAQAYLDWCGEMHPVYADAKETELLGYEIFAPKFSNSPDGYDFTQEENYYKLLEDFTSYDSVTGESAIQGDVTMTFPMSKADAEKRTETLRKSGKTEEEIQKELGNVTLTAEQLDAYKQRLRDTGLYTDKEIERYAEKAQMGFKDIVRAAVNERAEYRKATEPNFDKTYNEVKNALLNGEGVGGHKIERSTLEERRAKKGKTLTGEDIEEKRHSLPSDEEYMAAVESGDTARAQEMVDEAARRAGYTFGKVYHGTPNSDFTVFRDGIIFFTSNEDTASEYQDPGTMWATRYDKGRTIGAYIKLDNPLMLDNSYSDYRNEHTPWQEWKPTVYGRVPDNAMTAQQVAERAKAEGYDGVFIANDKDTKWADSSKYLKNRGRGDTVVAFKSNQVKSADPVTYDDDGNIIPLSERFRTDRTGKEKWKNEDIRYSVPSAEEADADVRYSLRTDPPPKKTQYGFKLMQVGEDGKPHAMFVDRNSPFEYGVWYDADSPAMADLENLEPGYAYLVDRDGNVDMDSCRPVEKNKSSFKGLPGKTLVDSATADGKRWMVVSEYSNGEKSYHNVGINGSGTVSVYALRPGLHAVDIPSMRHIGAKSDGSKKIDKRRPNERWFLIEYPVDRDYNAEAYSNASKDIPDHLPKDGWYSYQTNSGAEAKQHWFITGAMKIIGPVSEADAKRYAESHGQKADLPWTDGKSYDDGDAIDLDEYVRTTKAKPTPSKGEMRKRLDAKAFDRRYSLPGENPAFDAMVAERAKRMANRNIEQYRKKLTPEARAKHQEDYPKEIRKSQANSSLAPFTEEERKEIGELTHAVVTNDALKDMVASRLQADEAGEKRRLFRKGNKWDASDHATAQELIAREAEKGRESGDQSEARRLMRSNSMHMSDWGLIGHTASEVANSKVGVVSDAAETLDQAAQREKHNQKKRNKANQVVDGLSNANNDALNKIKEDTQKAQNRKKRTIPDKKTADQGGSNMVGEPFIFEYADKVGEALARSVNARVNSKEQSKTFMQQLTKEIQKFAYDTMPKRKRKGGVQTTPIDLLKSYVANQEFFEHAWRSANQELRQKYGEEIPADVQRFLRGWYGLGDHAINSKIMRAALVHAAMESEETMDLIRKQAALGAKDIGLKIAEDLAKKTGANGSLFDMMKLAADNYVDEVLSTGKESPGKIADRLINSALRDIGKAIDKETGPSTMKRLGSTSGATKAVVHDAVVNTLMNKYATTEADAERVAELVGNRFDALLRQGMEERLKTMFKEREKPDAKKQKAFLDRVIELTRLGAMESVDYHDAAIAKLFDGYTTRQGVKVDDILNKIYDYAEKLESVPKGDIENLKKMVSELNAERWTGGMLKGNEIHKTLQKAIDEVAEQAGGEQFLRGLIAAQIRGIANDNAKLTAVEAASTIRYISMLSKLTTFMRNIVGNTTFDIAESVSQNMAVPMDILLSAVTKRRTTTVDRSYFGAAKRRGMAEAAKRAYIEAALDASIEDGMNRWEMRDDRTFKMMKRNDAKGLRKAANGIERFMSTMEKWQRYLLTVSDEFYKGGIEAEIQHGLDKLKEKGKLGEDELQELAHQIALERTFQNKDKMATMVGGLRSAADIIGVTDYKGNKFGLGTALMPFARVPANLVGQVFNYSPLGGVKALGEIALVIKNGKNATAEQQAQAVRDFGRAFNGTSFIGVLTLAALKGLLNVAGAGSGDDDEKALERDEGKTGTQLNVSALIRWMNGDNDPKWQKDDVLLSVGGIEPLNGPMAFAGLLAASVDKEGAWWAKLANANFETAFQALGELPAMSTVNNIVNSYKYSDEKYDEELNPNGGPALQVADAAAQGLSDIGASFVPNILSGIAQGMDEGTVRTTRTSDKRGLAAVPEETLNAVKLKIPGLRQTLPEALDSFGQPRKSTAGKGQNWLNSNLFPLAINSFQPNPVSEELISLRKAGADITMPPRNAIKSVNTEDGSKKLTESERRKYQKTVGKTEIETMKDAMDDPAYQKMNAQLRANVWANLKSYATAEGKQAVGGKAEIPEWSQKGGGSLVDKAINRTFVEKMNKDLPKKGTTKGDKMSYLLNISGGDEEKTMNLFAQILDDGQMQKVKYLHSSDHAGGGYSYEQIANFYDAYCETSYDFGTKKNGEPKSRTKKQLIEWATSHGYSEGQANWLYKVFEGKVDIP